MPLTPEAYFDHIRACIHPEFIQDAGNKPVLTLKERMEGGKVVREVKFPFEGQAFSINLDLPLPTRRKGEPEKREPIRLFRFLEDEAKPWAKKCDFVVFHRLPAGIYAYLMEFKSNGVDGAGIKYQLDSSVNWLRSLKQIVKHYYGHTRPIKVQKFIFSSNSNPGQYLDGAGKYLKYDPTIRFYQYDALAELSLGDLENIMIDTI